MAKCFINKVTQNSKNKEPFCVTFTPQVTCRGVVVVLSPRLSVAVAEAVVPALGVVKRSVGPSSSWPLKEIKQLKGALRCGHVGQRSSTAEALTM